MKRLRDARHPMTLCTPFRSRICPIRELDHEALPGGIEIPLAGVFGAGEAVSRCQLERAESVGVVDPGVVLSLLGREVVHEEVDVVSDRARRLGVGFVEGRRDEVAD